MKSPFDKKMYDRGIEIFWENITDQLRIMDVAKFEKFWGTVKTLNKINTPMLDETELRVTFDVLCDDEKRRRGIEIIEPASTIESLNLMYTMKDEKRVYIPNTENMYRILKKHTNFNGRLRYDTFKNCFEVLDRGNWRTQEDHDIIDFQTKISVSLPVFARISKDVVRDGMLKVSKENTVDTARDYISTIVWDNEPRLDQWLMHTYGVEDNEYHRKVGSNWMKGLVKRIVFPGCKFDYVLVLEGEQGVKKSTSLAVLGGHWHAETTMSTDTKDFFMQFAGKAIIEFSEGETLSRTEVKRMKAIITMQSDRYRMPYERATLDFPRRCVFAMTTNQSEYLKDETGNRRWLPVRVVLPEANIAWLEENREQLFAEAYYRVSVLNETLYEFPKEDMLREQNARMIHDPNEELISDWYYNELKILDREKGITVHRVYHECLHRGNSIKPLNKYEEMQISNVLISMGLIKKREMRGGARMTTYYPKSMSTPSELQAIIKQENHDLF